MSKRNRKAQPSKPEAVSVPLKSGLHRGLVGTLLALVILTPLYFTTSLSDYNTPKLAFVQVLTALACALWFVGMAAEGKVYLIRSPIYYALLAFMAANFISLFQAYNQPHGLEMMFQYLCHFLLYIVVFNCIRVEREGWAILWAIAGTASVISVVGLLQYHHIYDFHSQWSLPVSTLGNVTYVAEYLDIALPVAFALALGGRGAGRYAAGGAVLVMLFLIAVLGSRGGWVGAGVSAAIFVVAWGWRGVLAGRRLLEGSALRVAVGVAVVAVLVGVVPRLPAGNGVTVGKVLEDRWTAIFERSEAAVRLQDESSRQRVLIWKDTVRMILDRPLLGVGVGNFAYTLPKYASRESAESLARMRTAAGMDLAVYQAHNGYLEVLAETGVLGLAAFLWMFYAVCGMFYRLLRRYARGEADALAVGLAAAAAATLVHALFSLNFQNPASASHFWVATGLAAILERGGREERIPLLETRSGSGVLTVVGVCVAAVLLAGVVSYNAVVADHYYNEGRYDLKASPQRLERARFNLERSVAYRPYSFGAHQMLGNTFNAMRLWDEAEAAYRKSLRYHPNNRMVHKLLGEVLMRSGRHEEAIERFKAATRLDPVFAEAYFRLGYCERQVGRNDEAIRAYSEALTLEPQNVEFMNSLGAARIAKGDYQGAISDLSRAAAARPNHAGVQTNLGIAYFSLGQTQEALDHYRRAVALDPQQSNAYVLIGHVYQEQLKDEAKAREYYEKALALNPDDARIGALMRSLEKQGPEAGGRGPGGSSERAGLSGAGGGSRQGGLREGPSRPVSTTPGLRR